MHRYPISISLAVSILLICSSIGNATPLLKQFSVSAIAQTTTNQANQDLPSILAEGFEAYRTQGVIAASEVWFQNSPDYLRNQGTIVARQIAGNLQGVGVHLGYSVLYSTFVTANTQLLYIESQYEYGTAFWRFVVSTHNHESIVTAFRFDTDPTAVLPDFLIYRE